MPLPFASLVLTEHDTQAWSPHPVRGQMSCFQMGISTWRLMPIWGMSPLFPWGQHIVMSFLVAKHLATVSKIHSPGRLQVTVMMAGSHLFPYSALWKGAKAGWSWGAS